MLRPSFLFCVVVGILVKISGIKYSVEYIAEYVVPFVSMSASDMSAAAYSLA